MLRIVSIANGEIEDGGGYYQYPCIDFDVLERYSEGVTCSSACVSSYLSELISRGEGVLVNDYIDRMLNIFGDDFWLEIMPHDFAEQRTLNFELYRIGQERGIPLVATNDAHFPYKDWAKTQQIAKMMGINKSFSDAEKRREEGDNEKDYLLHASPTLYLASEEDMREWFIENHPALPVNAVDESIRNTAEFTRTISPFLLDKSLKLPKVTESPESSIKILRQWIKDGLERVGEADNKEYLERIEFEWKVLEDKGVLDYFVMVGEICRYCHDNDIRVGLGRGSAAGCLISYLIGITQIDPIPYGLLFERFLNPERKGLPDIDLDFQSDRRDEVKRFIAKRYGRHHVADVITHSTFQPKKVIQDLCRVYDVPYAEAHAVTDTIDIRQDDEETTLEELLPLNDKLQEFKANQPEIWEQALRFEGRIANSGKHAAAIIITPEPVVNYMSLERGKKGDLVTSWSDAADFPVVSDYGFVKLDALGIKGLQKHDYACRLIYERTGEHIKLNELPALRDPHAVDEEVLDGFREGYTVGIFQFGGPGITGLLREIKPDSILDIAAANALYRPGPMKGGVTWEYAKRKHGKSETTYWHDIVRPILGKTYGLVAYQEQVMEIAKQIGGFSAAEADDLRKAMGKLYRIKGGSAAKEYMAQYEDKWYAGAESKGISRHVAEEIWGKILEYGHYGFNLSHSASYALQAYQDMYLKVKYPAEFYAAFLTYEDDDDKKKAALREAKARGIDIIMPDINISDSGYTVKDGKLILGLTAIKGVGERSADVLIKNRPYHSIEDFMQRSGNQSTRELVEAGALDSLADRGLLLSVVPKVNSKVEAEWYVWEHLKHNAKLKIPRPLPEERVEPAPASLVQIQAASLNLPVSSLNLSDEAQTFIRDNIYTVDEVNEAEKGDYVIVGGEITKVVRKQTKKGKDFANVTIVFAQNEWSIKLWHESLARFDQVIHEGAVVMVAGKKDEWNGRVSIVANNVTAIEEIV